MRMKSTFAFMVIAAFMVSWAFLPDSGVDAQEKLRFSCSAQVYEAFERECLQAFTKQTGIEVDLYIASSSSSVNRLMYGISDIASTARGLHYPLVESGYVETPFCRDPIAIIVNEKCPVNNISEEQLGEIFAGHYTHWRDVGGPDEPIIVVIPGKNTAAFDNFTSQVMKRKDIKYDFLSYKSTGVLDIVERFPFAISFAAQGAAAKHEGIKMLKINGLAPMAKGYPFYQEFSFVTKGKPSGYAKALVDFAFSHEAKELISKKGMVPLPRP